VNADMKELNHFPSLFKEGWIRPQFCRIALTLRGDGVVIAKSGWHFHHLPQIHVNMEFSRISDWFAWIWVLLLSEEENFSVH